MAFQGDPPFCEFLRDAARSVALAEAAPAANFLLDERVPAERERTFLASRRPATPVAWDVPSWMAAFGNHFTERVAVRVATPRRCDTFAQTNKENLLLLEESNQDVVRLESVRGFFDLAKTEFGSADDLTEALRRLVAAREAASPLDPDEDARLHRWLDALNLKRDARPMFVTPFGEVEPLLKNPDWPRRIRDVLGLAHLGGTPAKSLPVVLMRYSLSRVEAAARKARTDGGAAVPTVLEAGSHQGPNPSFFPYPEAARRDDAFGFGLTVDLGDGDSTEFKAELLHFRIDYRLDDFWTVGEIRDTVTDSQLAAARARHFALLESDFRFRKDVP